MVSFGGENTMQGGSHVCVVIDDENPRQENAPVADGININIMRVLPGNKPNRILRESNEPGLPGRPDSPDWIKRKIKDARRISFS
jgi:hypothetical protein